MILIYNGLYLIFPQCSPPTPELLCFEMWLYFRHGEFQTFLFLAVCLKLVYRIRWVFIITSDQKFASVICRSAFLGISGNVTLLLAWLLFQIPAAQNQNLSTVCAGLHINGSKGIFPSDLACAFGNNWFRALSLIPFWSCKCAAQWQPHMPQRPGNCYRTLLICPWRRIPCESHWWAVFLGYKKINVSA